MKTNLDNPSASVERRELDDIDLLNIYHYPESYAVRLFNHILKEPQYRQRLEQLLGELAGKKKKGRLVKLLKKRQLPASDAKAVNRAVGDTLSSQSAEVPYKAALQKDGFPKGNSQEGRSRRASSQKGSTKTPSPESKRPPSKKGIIGRLFR